MNLRILDEAAAEFADAIARYESIESGLGVRFKEEIKSVVAWIADQPELPRVRSSGYRRVNLKVFPSTHRHLMIEKSREAKPFTRPLRQAPGILDHPHYPV